MTYISHSSDWTDVCDKVNFSVTVKAVRVKPCMHDNCAYLSNVLFGVNILTYISHFSDLDLDVCDSLSVTVKVAVVKPCMHINCAYLSNVHFDLVTLTYIPRSS